MLQTFHTFTLVYFFFSKCHYCEKISQTIGCLILYGKVLSGFSLKHKNVHFDPKWSAMTPTFLSMKMKYSFFFSAEKNLCILHGQVFFNGLTILLLVNHSSLSLPRKSGSSLAIHTYIWQWLPTTGCQS